MAQVALMSEMLAPATAIPEANPVSVPLCVDLDGSLVATDTLVESVLLMVKQSPTSLLKLPFWLIQGKRR